MVNKQLKNFTSFPHNQNDADESINLKLRLIDANLEHLDAIVEQRVGMAISKIISSLNINSSSFAEFEDDSTARLTIGGGRKQISKKKFNDLRRDGLIKTYYPSPGRTSYKRSELLQYLESTGKEAHILPPKNKITK